MSTRLDSTRSSTPTRRERRAERRRLQRTDVLTARLGELEAIRSVLQRAIEVVTHGWVQGAWFVVTTPGGHPRVIGAQEVRRATSLPVVGAPASSAASSTPEADRVRPGRSSSRPAST